jgi:MFS family permease
MALYLAIFMGGTPVGAPIIGWVGGQFGARWTILIGGLVSLLAALAALTWLMLTKRATGTDPRATSPDRALPTDPAPAPAPAAAPAPAPGAAAAFDRAAVGGRPR